MKSYKISVNGKSYDVTVEELGATGSAAQSVAASQPALVSRPLPASPTAQSMPGPPSAPAPAAPSAGAAGLVKSPMPGTLLSFKVAKGQTVRRGEVLLILEAMKMENEIVAPVDGVVSALRVAEGASVSTGDVLVELA